MSNQNIRGIQTLFKRPLEPLFTVRDRVSFDIPDNYYTDRYRPIGQDISNRITVNDTDERIPLRQINHFDLSFANNIDKDGCFSVFNTRHRTTAATLIEVFMRVADVNSLTAIAAYCRDRLNPYMFQYALTVALAHRPDTKNIAVPSVVQVFPDQFVDPKVFRKLREEALVPIGSRQPVEIPLNFTADAREVEQRLAYFREDIGINAHHWHWHLVYPPVGPTAIVNKDRRGELFYYMHQQIMSRYNIERFSNGLGRAKALLNFRDIIPEAYFPKIIRSANNRAYPPRVANSRMMDVNRDGINIQIAELERFRSRIIQAIDQGFAVDAQGQQVPLTEPTGIDILGNLFEASTLSINAPFYGNLHNDGHTALSFIHDPDGRFLEDFSPIGDVSTAMRDPVFYKLHALVDSIFLRYKSTMSPYTNQQLGFSGVSVQSIGVQVTRGSQNLQNTLLTYWQKSQVDLSAGLDFGPEGNVFAEFTHLQHAPFVYRIITINTGGRRQGTCRIFIAPHADETGAAMSFRDQRLLMIEMDRFVVTLNPGQNIIQRRSDESNLTIPFERTFRPVGAANQPTDPNALSQFQFCGCGWPHHMLVPKGTAEGMRFDMFVMISNFADDTTNQTIDGSSCNDAAVYCGIRDRLYPDKRPMGFPFDRNSLAVTLQSFAARRNNMAVQQIHIRFSNTLVTRS